MRVFVSGEYREIDDDVWYSMRGPWPPFGFVNNGCSCSPDYLPSDNAAVWPACVIHDWHYSGNIILSREEADSRFRKNIYTCLRMQGVFFARAAFVAFTYWRAVRRLGASHYKEWKRAA